VPGVKGLRVTYRKKLQELPNPIRKKAGGRRGEGERGGGDITNEKIWQISDVK
jgi:hypothetical protein